MSVIAIVLAMVRLVTFCSGRCVALMAAKASHQEVVPCRSISPRADRLCQFMSWPTVILLSSLAAGCASAPLDRASSLRSYNNLTPSNGLLTRSLLRVSEADVLAAKTARIIPTAFMAPARQVPFSPDQRNLITNAVDRALCSGLSKRFKVVGPSESADLTVHAVVTHVAPTNPVAVALSKGTSVATSVFLPNIPVPVPRIPIGLGSLSLEAEARDHHGRQKAAMIWGRGANAFLDSGRVAEDGDAYSFAAEFGADFSKLLVTGKTPFGTLSLPASIEGLRTLLSGAKYPVCEAFGRSPGVAGLIGETIGLPPDWTDKGAARPSPMRWNGARRFSRGATEKNISERNR
jgi:Protein of unknown function (DUF3313)